MDDLFSGAPDIESALRLQRELMLITASAGFKFKKWASNRDEILLAIPEESRELNVPVSLDPEKLIKTLGIQWNQTDDVFTFSINFQDPEKPTKRSTLSSIAKLFDPLGFLSPIIVMAKIFMKRVWSPKISWDKPLPNELIEEWKKLISKTKTAQKITIPRWIKSANLMELHVFCDASKEAYDIVIYLRSINEIGQSSS